MSASDRPQRWALAFGDLEAGLWGVALGVTGGEGVAHLSTVSGRDSPLQTVPALDPQAPREEWRLHGEASQLTLTPSTPAAEIVFAGHGVDGFAQLCRAEGRFMAGGQERIVDCSGWRSIRSDLGTGWDSSREVAAWFGPGEGLAVTALRPRKTRGHEEDDLASVLFEGGRQVPVEDPRLSSTYTATGSPARASLELWIEGEQVDAEPGESTPQQFPRRAAGEAIGSGAQLRMASLRVEVELFRWRVGRRDGAGVYVISRSA